MFSKSRPFVSVIIPSFNRREMLKGLLESLNRLTYPLDRFEVIMVDNGSQDGTWGWLQQNCSQLRCSTQCFRRDSSAGGPAVARNTGLHHAKGEIIAFTDSDCVVAKEWLDEGVAGFRDGVGFVQGKTIPCPGDSRPILFVTTTVLSEKSNRETCNIFYTREALACVDGFSQDFGYCGYPMYGEDLDLAYRVTEAGYQSVFAEKAVVMHRIIPLTLWQWLIQPLLAFTWPYIVRKHPQIRSDLLFLRYFLNRMTALFDLFLLGLFLSWLLSPWFLLLGVPFLVARYKEGGEHLNFVMRLVRLFGSSLRGMIICGVLACGSIRFRTLLL